jgi:hypothetical protein
MNAPAGTSTIGIPWASVMVGGRGTAVPVAVGTTDDVASERISLETAAVQAVKNKSKTNHLCIASFTE